METKVLVGNGKVNYISSANMNNLIRDEPTYINQVDNHIYNGTYNLDTVYKNSKFIDDEDVFDKMIKKQNEMYEKIKEHKNFKLGQVATLLPGIEILKNQVKGYNDLKLKDNKKYFETNPKMNRYLSGDLNTKNIIKSLRNVDRNQVFDAKRVINNVYDSFVSGTFDYYDSYGSFVSGKFDSIDKDFEFENIIKLALSLGIHKNKLIETTKSASDSYRSTLLLKKLVALKQQRNARVAFEK